VAVTAVGEGLWRVDAAPVFAYGFVVGDVLRAEVDAAAPDRSST
jgi:hypothetical protein